MERMEEIHFLQARRMRLAVMLAGVSLMLFSQCAVVVCDAGDREVLRGIKTIGIEVEKVPRMAERIGIRQDTLKMEVLAKLRLAGVAIAGEDEYKHNPSIPFLKVSLLISYNKPTYVYAVVVGLNEKVHLARDPEIISYSLPWWRIIKGEHIGESDLAKDVHETLRHIMNEFVASYEAANREAVTPEEMKNEGQNQPLEGASGQDTRDKKSDILH